MVTQLYEYAKKPLSCILYKDEFCSIELYPNKKQKNDRTSFVRRELEIQKDPPKVRAENDSFLAVGTRNNCFSLLVFPYPLIFLKTYLYYFGEFLKKKEKK